MSVFLRPIECNVKVDSVPACRIADLFMPPSPYIQRSTIYEDCLLPVTVPMGEGEPEVFKFIQDCSFTNALEEYLGVAGEGKSREELARMVVECQGAYSPLQFAHLLHQSQGGHQTGFPARGDERKIFLPIWDGKNFVFAEAGRICGTEVWNTFLRLFDGIGCWIPGCRISFRNPALRFRS